MSITVRRLHPSEERERDRRRGRLLLTVAGLRLRLSEVEAASLRRQLNQFNLDRRRS